ncbi:MAG: tRNA (guanosine(46)-N7)-methyltransferase TrmB [Bdellovibrionota bacterium]
MKKLGTIIDNLKQGLDAPTRHHNPYLQEAISLNNHLYTEAELAKNKNTLFEQNENLIVEIGCYMGKNVTEMAVQNKELNFFGLDITYKRAVKAARKLKHNNIENAKIALCDGKVFLEEYIQPHSLLGVCVFFPDPWPKDRHEKNRLLKQDFINLLKNSLSPKGFFWFKTDSTPYFQQTEKCLLESGFKRDDISLDGRLNQPRVLNGGPYETAFQKIFAAKNVPFHQGVYVLCP